MICCLNSLVKTQRLRLIIGGFLLEVYHPNFLSHCRGAVQTVRFHLDARLLSWTSFRLLRFRLSVRYISPSSPIAATRIAESTSRGLMSRERGSCEDSTRRLGVKPPRSTQRFPEDRPLRLEIVQQTVILGLLFALKGVGNRAFYRWCQTTIQSSRACSNKIAPAF